MTERRRPIAMERTRVDIAVVGGGPAGTSAATAAAASGASTILFDAPAVTADRTPDDLAPSIESHGPTTVGRLDRRDATTVWGIFAGNVLGTTGPGGAAEVEAGRIVLATGARRVREPAPGWTQPDIQLALMAECAAGYSEPLGGWVPGRTRDLVTSNVAILVAGDCAGLCSNDVAVAEGRLAGLSAALGLGYGSEAERADARTRLERLEPDRTATMANLSALHVQGHQAPIVGAGAFATTLDGDAPTGETHANAMLPNGTVVCPCEGITEAAVMAAIADGATSLTDIKRRTRAGMGVCQGLLCGRPIAKLIAQETGLALSAISPMTSRPPVGPIRLAALAGVVMERSPERDD